MADEWEDFDESASDNGWKGNSGGVKQNNYSQQAKNGYCGGGGSGGQGREKGGEYRRDEYGNDGGSSGGCRREGDRNGGGGYRRDGGDRNGGGNNRGKFDDSDNDGESNGGLRGRGGSGPGGGGRGGYNGEAGGGRRNRGDDENGFDGNGDKVTSDKPREFYIPLEPTTDENEIFNTGISSGINFAKYDNIPVHVTPSDTVPIVSFEESGLRPFVLNNVKKSGYTKPTPIQKYAIRIIMQKNDLMACAQTGSGKTAAFLLPIINELLENNKDLDVSRPHCFIISPTRELAIQIFNEARKFALSSILRVDIAYGGTSTRHQSSNIARGCHILVCTPGRLLDFVDKGLITFEDTRFVVLDEADRMLDMGFMPAVEKVMNHSTMTSFENRQTLMFSATFPEDIQRLAAKFLNNYVFLAIGIVGGACSDVEQNFYQVGRFEKYDKLRSILEENHADGGIMVFVETKRNADVLAVKLSQTRFPTTSIHGDRMQREREEALRDFKSGKMAVLIATSVAARGLDIRNVSHVINYDLPKGIDEYVHRIGRTGRVGNNGKATSFYDPENDSALASGLIKILKQANQEIPDFLASRGGGDSGFGNSRFGGRDVRSRRNLEVDANTGYAAATSEPAAQERNEEW